MLDRNSDFVSTDGDYVSELTFLLTATEKQTEKKHIGNRWFKLPISIQGLFEIISRIDKDLAEKVLKRYKVQRRFLELIDECICEKSEDHPREQDECLLGSAEKHFRLYLTEPIYGRGIGVTFSLIYTDGNVICVRLFKTDGSKFRLVFKRSDKPKIVIGFEDNWEDAIYQCLRG